MFSKLLLAAASLMCRKRVWILISLCCMLLFMYEQNANSQMSSVTDYSAWISMSVHTCLVNIPPVDPSPAVWSFSQQNKPNLFPGCRLFIPSVLTCLFVNYFSEYIVPLRLPLCQSPFPLRLRHSLSPQISFLYPLPPLFSSVQLPLPPPHFVLTFCPGEKITVFSFYTVFWIACRRANRARNCLCVWEEKQLSLCVCEDFISRWKETGTSILLGTFPSL